MNLDALRAGVRRPPLPNSALDPPKRRPIARTVGRAIGILAALLVVGLLGFQAAAWLRETHRAADLAPATGRFVPTAHGQIFVQEKGPVNGPAVILIHGTAAWSELWRETIDHLADSQYRVIAIDLPPFGFSDRPADRSYTRRDHAQRIAALIDALGLPSAYLVGHSFGAGPTVETVLRFPHKVRGLVLVDGALGISDPAGAQDPPGLVTALLDLPALRNPLVAATVTNPLMTHRLLSLMVHRQDAANARRVAILQRPMSLRDSTLDLGRWLGYFVSIDKTAWSMDRGRYAAIKTKTVLIWGDQDTLTPLAQARDLERLIAGSSLTVLPGLGHIPQIEDPAVFAPALVDALRRLN